MLRPFALYIHVPFCSRKCPYCDFNTYATLQVPEKDYVRALLMELRAYARDQRFEGRRISSIFWGGGTPSLLSPAALGEVHAEARALFGIEPGAEVTLEANPASPSKDRYAACAAAGVNRVSFGVQSFDARRLELLGRDHTPENARDAVRLCVEAGIPNVSVDLIFGVAEQSLKDLEDDLCAAAALPVTHISTYALTIEPGTPFFQRQERGLLSMPSDGLVAEMLERIPLVLSSQGFARYEISNYARDGLTSRHNEAYWLGQDYLGIGAGAHSYIASHSGGRRVSGSRWSTLALPASYMKAAGTPSTVSWREELSIESLMFEFFYLGLRRMAGVSLADFEPLFGPSALPPYQAVVHELTEEGFLRREGDNIQLTTAGIALADSVYERFVL
jgi:oxygen-independent coproporphyrinogen-3 oxidase